MHLAIHAIHHSEHHFTSGNFVRDIVIGMADGLTVPFALAAGLSGAVSSNRLIVIGGLAEIAAGSIAMDSADILPRAAMPSTTSWSACARNAKSSKFRRRKRRRSAAYFSPMT